MNPNSFYPSLDENVNLKVELNDIIDNGSLKHIVSTYNFEDQVIRDGFYHEGMKIVTFANVLQYNIFPLAEILNTLLDIGQREMNNHVEIEFAVNMDVPEGEPMIFSFLQIRPVVEFLEKEHVKIEQDNQESSIIISNSALGNGVINDLHDIIYVKQESFDALNNTK